MYGGDFFFMGVCLFFSFLFFSLYVSLCTVLLFRAQLLLLGGSECVHGRPLFLSHPCRRCDGGAQKH